MLDIYLPHFRRIDELYNEINEKLPAGQRGEEEFRADLAGMFVVTCVAMYESCVKDTLLDYASRRNPRFEFFVLQAFGKLNSRIQVRDLHKYTKQFDDVASKNFKKRLARRKVLIGQVANQDLEKRYEQLLDWRHGFAHAGARTTTLEEAYATHRIAKHVIQAFGHAFDTCISD